MSTSKLRDRNLFLEALGLFFWGELSLGVVSPNLANKLEGEGNLTGERMGGGVLLLFILSLTEHLLGERPVLVLGRSEGRMFIADIPDSECAKFLGGKFFPLES